MKTSRVLSLVVLAWAMMMVALGPVDAAPLEFRVGDVFPDLTLPALDDGKPVSLGTFRGRKLVLHVWASW